jgi:hypothetical protein
MGEAVLADQWRIFKISDPSELGRHIPRFPAMRIPDARISGYLFKVNELRHTSPRMGKSRRCSDCFPFKNSPVEDEFGSTLTFKKLEASATVLSFDKT